jgi:hypothetical protein
MLSRVIDQETPHRRGGDGEKLGAVLPHDSALAGEPKVGFVHKSSGPQRVIHTFPGEIAAGLPSELLIDQRNELFTRSRVAGTPSPQQTGEIRGRGAAHVPPPDSPARRGG